MVVDGCIVRFFMTQHDMQIFIANIKIKSVTSLFNIRHQNLKRYREIKQKQKITNRI